MFYLEHLAQIIQTAHQWIPFCVASPLQYAIGEAIAKSHELNWFNQLRLKLIRRRNNLVNGLQKSGLTSIIPQGGYFVLADTSKFQFKFDSKKTTRDFAFCRWMIRTHGLGPIPISTFYTKQNAYLANNLARFAICKSDDLINSGLKRLKDVKQNKKSYQ